MVRRLAEDGLAPLPSCSADDPRPTQTPAGPQLARTHRGITVAGTRDPVIATQPHELKLTLRHPATQITSQLRITDASGLTTKLEGVTKTV